MDADMLAHREHVGAVNQPLIAVRRCDFHFIVDALKINGEPEYVQEVQDSIDSGDDLEGGDSEYDDPMIGKAIEVIRTAQKASTSLLQRKLGIGYGRAAKIIDILEEDGKISPPQGAQGQREIYL